MGQRKAVTAKLAAEYRRGSRTDKARILDELCRLTNWHRDHARKALRHVGTVRVTMPRSPKPPTYADELIAALACCWRIARYPTGKRLAPMLPMLVEALRRDGELIMSDEDAHRLSKMSAPTIDRRLAPVRQLLVPHGRSHTKPGTLLKSQIPIRTWSDWNEGTPGFVEVDLVGHEGGNPFGEFCFTLTMTDVATGWTINRSVANKAAIHVRDAIDFARRLFPFPILGIDSDIQYEFVPASTSRPAGEERLRGDRCPFVIADDRSERLATPCPLVARRTGAPPGGNVLLGTRRPATWSDPCW